jgi:hypothetical protein
MEGSHRQDPMLFLVPVAGEGASVEDLEREALEAVLRAAEAGATSLSGSGSVQATAENLLAASPTLRALHG